MDKIGICSYISLISESLLSIFLINFKLKKYYIISFNSFYLLMLNIISLKIFHLIYLINPSNANFYFFILLIIFLFSYIIRIKRMVDCISLSTILKSRNIKNKTKELFEKFNYSLEIKYLANFAILSFTIVMLFYFLNKINTKKYLLLISSIIILSYSCFKIAISDLKKKLKRNYILGNNYISNIIFKFII